MVNLNLSNKIFKRYSHFFDYVKKNKNFDFNLEINQNNHSRKKNTTCNSSAVASSCKKLQRGP